MKVTFLKKVWSNRRSVYHSMIISYLSILLIPVLISMIIYNNAVNIVEDEINHNNELMLSQLQHSFDSRLLDVERVVKEISFNPEVNGIINSQVSIDATYRYKIVRLFKECKIYKFGNEFIQDIYLFFDNYNTVLSTGQHMERHIASKMDYVFNGNSYEDWIELLTTKQQKGYISLEKELPDGEKREAHIAYIQPLPIDGTDQVLGNIVILIKEDMLSGLIKSMDLSSDEGIVFIADEEDIIINKNGIVQLPESLKSGNLQVNAGLVYESINDEKYAISYIKSNIAKWTYISAIPVRIFSKKLNYINTIAKIGLLLCAILGGIAALLYARKNYTPITDLIGLFRDKDNSINQQGRNEYHFIKDRIGKAIYENKKLNQIIEQQNIIVRNDFFVRLLKGWKDQHTLGSNSASQLDVRFISDSFAVMIFHIDVMDTSLSTDNMHKNQKEDIGLIKYIIGNAVEETVNKYHQSNMIEVDGMTVCLVSINKDRIENVNNDLTDASMQAQIFLKDNFKVALTVSISNVHNGLEDICKAYQEAVESMEYTTVFENKSIIQYDNLKELTSTSKYPYLSDKEKMLANYIKAGDDVRAEAILDEILMMSVPSIYITKCLLYDLISTMLKTLDETGLLNNSPFLGDINPVKGIGRYNTIDTKKQYLRDYLKQVCEYVSMQKKSQGDELTNMVIHYVEEHYSDGNLNAAEVAESVNRNTAYLSRFFKEQTGLGIPDYINKVRLEKAKLLLKDSNFKIKDIAEQVGFLDSGSMIRVFKRHEGITPGQYKEYT